MIRKFEDYKTSNRKELLYYSFDWDDNILHMDTVIHMERLINEQWHPVDVSTEEFAKIRNDKNNYRLLNDNPDVAFCEFGDKGNRGSNAFLEDVRNSISNGGFAPSWSKFVDCIVSGSLFSIITARGHEPESIKNAVRWIIETQLTTEQQGEMITNLLEFHKEFNNEPNEQIIEDYLDFNFYFGVSSETFTSRFKSELNTDSTIAMSPEKAKEVALKYFVEKAHKYGDMIDAKVSIGFSDDDSRNVEHIENLMRGELSLKYPMSTLMIYDTSDRGYRKIKINETHMSEEEVNPNYEFFVVYSNERILSGWEYEQDAWDDYNVRIESNRDMEDSITVCSVEECNDNGIDPFNWDCWISDDENGGFSDFNQKIDNEEIMESKKKKVNKATESNTGASVDIAKALPKEEMGEDKDIAVCETKSRLMSFSQFSVNESDKMMKWLPVIMASRAGMHVLTVPELLEQLENVPDTNVFMFFDWHGKKDGDDVMSFPTNIEVKDLTGYNIHMNHYVADPKIFTETDGMKMLTFDTNELPKFRQTFLGFGDKAEKPKKSLPLPPHLTVGKLKAKLKEIGDNAFVAVTRYDGTSYFSPEHISNYNVDTYKVGDGAGNIYGAKLKTGQITTFGLGSKMSVADWGSYVITIEPKEDKTKK